MCAYYTTGSMDFSSVVERLLTFKEKTAGEFSPVVERLIIFEKIPVLERLIFSGENPFAGDFLAPFSTKKTLI